MVGKFSNDDSWLIRGVEFGINEAIALRSTQDSLESLITFFVDTDEDKIREKKILRK